MKTCLNEDDITRKFLAKSRKLNEDFQSDIQNGENPTQNQNLAPQEQKDEVVIDKNDDNFIEVQNNITNFVGALKIDDKAEIVYPKDSDVVFNGVITDMNNLKFQFKYNDQSGGLYIWVDSMLLTKDISEKLAKLVVIRDQWKEYWSNTIGQYTQQK